MNQSSNSLTRADPIKRKVLMIIHDPVIASEGDQKLHDVFNWNAATDRHMFSGRSILFDKISERYGKTPEQISYELNQRKTTIEWMVKNGIQKQDAVSATITDFYADPEKFYERKRMLV